MSLLSTTVTQFINVNYGWNFFKLMRGSNQTPQQGAPSSPHYLPCFPVLPHIAPVTVPVWRTLASCSPKLWILEDLCNTRETHISLAHKGASTDHWQCTETSSLWIHHLLVKNNLRCFVHSDNIVRPLRVWAPCPQTDHFSAVQVHLIRITTKHLFQGKRVDKDFK